MSVVLRNGVNLMASRPGDPPLFDTEAVTPSAKKKLTAAKFKLLALAYSHEDLRKAGASVYSVLMYAVEKADADGRFWKKVSTIAREVGIDRSTVIRAMNTLTYHGFIERKGRHNGVGNSCNVYCLTLDLGGAMRAAKREARRRSKYPREQVGNSTEKPPLRSRSRATLEVATPPPQESQPCDTYTTLPDKPSCLSLGSAPLEGKKQVVQQGNGKLVEGIASIGEDIASGTIRPGKPSSPLHDTFDQSTSSSDEPLSSTLTVNRPIRAAEGPDHAQRSLGPMLVITGGLEKKAAEVDANTPAVAALVPLVAAKKSAIDAIGKRKFLERDLLLNHRLGAVPVKFQDGVRALEWISWANELVEEQHAAICTSTSVASGGAA